MSGALTARPRRETVGVLAALTLAELAALAAYLASVPVAITSSRYLLYPFVWLNVGAIAVWRVSPGPAAVSGVVAVGTGSGVTVHWALPPGWGPMVMGYVGPLRVAAAPYRIGGYLALAYLVYATLADAEASLVGGLVGVFTCVSCTLPVVAAVVSSLAGGAVAVGTASALSYDAATAVFVLAVGLLAWRPDAAVGRWLR